MIASGFSTLSIIVSITANASFMLSTSSISSTNVMKASTMSSNSVANIPLFTNSSANPGSNSIGRFSSKANCIAVTSCSLFST